MHTSSSLTALPVESWRVSTERTKELEKLLSGVELTLDVVTALTGSLDDRVAKIYESSVRATLPKLGFDSESMNYDCVHSYGPQLQARCEKAVILWTHHLDVLKEQDPERGMYRDVEMLTSRYADREMDVGAVVHLMDGFFVVDRLFTAGGACVSILKGMQGQFPKIVCRGTAVGFRAAGSVLSIFDDISEQIGQNGVQAVWPDLKKYIDENAITNVEVLGKSLGGGHAQALAVLLEGHGTCVDHLVTNAAVGVGDDVNDVFNSRILANREKPFKITVMRSGGDHEKDEVDYVPLIGGSHLGLGASRDKVAISICYLGLPDQDIQTPNPEASLMQMGVRLVNSLVKAHSRQNTWKKFQVKKIEEYQEVQKQLALGNGTESYRRSIARVLAFIFPTILRHEYFADYFEMNR